MQGLNDLLLLGDDDDALNALCQQVIKELAHTMRIGTFDGREREEEASLTGGLLYGHHGALRPEQGVPTRDQADCSRSLRDQCSGGKVAAISEFLDRMQHAVAGFGAHVPVVVENPRDGLV
jgi:hypothetical protein